MRHPLLLAAILGILGCTNRDAQDITGVKSSSPPVARAIETQATAYHVVFSTPVVAEPIAAGTASFGPSLVDAPDAVLENELIAARDPADASGPSPLDGCSPFTNAAAVAGRIALIQRGFCPFVDKVRNAQLAGAVAVVIYDNVPGAAARMAGVDPTITIPSIRITASAGNAIAAALLTGPTLGRIFVESGAAPSISVPTDVIAETTDPAGAAVTSSASGTTYLGPATPDCTPRSGSIFAQGVTAVQCAVTDIAGNSVSQSFSVTVRFPDPDVERPVLHLPNPVTVEATGPYGAIVNYVFGATDNIGVLSFGCSRPPGSAFSLGTTSVTCTATDAAGNVAAGSFTVTVVDTQAPVLTLPAPIVVDATTPAGASVTYTVSTSDIVSGAVAVTCSPAGNLFPIGPTVVSCGATDAMGNSTRGSFTVSVKGAATQISDLQQRVVNYDFTTGTETSLSAKLSAALQALASRNTTSACGSFGALINQVTAQTGKNIPVEIANALIADTRRILGVSGC